MGISKAFTEHPRAVGETYLQHLSVASRCGFEMIVAGLACVVHALFPFLFERTASDCLTRLYQNMVAKRSRLQRPSEAVGVPSPR